MKKKPIYDVAIIGGGINGCGCAADAAMRGLSVFLCEQGDIASQTSSRSSQLIHGGLRYLEHYDLALVKKALDEQQILMNVAPHLVHPLPFVLPCDPNGRPSWLLRAGLFLYDHLSFINQLPQSKRLSRANQATYFAPLSADIQDGFLFYDCQTNDARLTLVNALQAQHYGAKIANYTTLVEATFDKHWQLTLTSASQGTYAIEAKVVINAAGPWIEPVSALLNITLQRQVRLIKGSHVVVDRLYEGEHAYLLQHTDHRIVFVIPYQGYSLIGTTDIPYQGNLSSVAISDEEISYLAEVIQHAFNKSFGPTDIITSWSGVRTLMADKNAMSEAKPSELSRDYEVIFSKAPAPVITLYGGKITTYRQLAKEAIDTLKPIFTNLPQSISRVTPLPGASTDETPFSIYQPMARERFAWLDDAVLNHYLATYGTLTDKILRNCHTMTDLGLAFTPILYQAEVDYLIQNEWVTCSEDLLWRRTKLGLQMDAQSLRRLVDYFKTGELLTDEAFPPNALI